MRNLALCGLITLGLVLASPFGAMTSHAAEPLGLKNVSLWINPEYDHPAGSTLTDPTLLVMEEGQIVGATAPVTIKFLVPTGSWMNSAGSKDAQGTYIPPGTSLQQVPSTQNPGWDEVSYTLQTPTFRVEYYAPLVTTLVIGQNSRSVSYDFRTEYPISDMRVMVQEPLHSTSYKVTPAGTVQGTISTDSEGFTIHTFNYASIAANDPAVASVPVHFDISYTKASNTPSLGTSGGTSGGGSPPNWPLILGILAFVVVAAVVFILMKSKFSPSRAPARTNIPRRGSTARINQAGAKASGTGKAGGKFCNKCGQPVETGAQFCPYCGNKLRP